DGETVTLDPADVDFDDEKGITIEGYELDEETGAWVEAISEAMQQTNKLIETYGLADEVAEGKITVTEEGGAVNVTDNETGTVLMRTIGEQTKYELGFAVDGIAAKSCEPTDFRPNKRGLLLAEYAKAYLVYMNKIMKELGFKKYNANLYSILIDREKQCWGLVVSNDIIFYRDGEGVAHGLPLIAIPESKIEDFQVTR
ncbi:MAG: hypothetical protein DYG85_04190, partial [Chloroflexi bacterium CFX1]|nr:hypothetical protein [Chloroflexi bacterium CFX1]